MAIPIELREALDAKNNSLYDFAHRHKESYDTVKAVAARWYLRTDRKPHGGISRKILKKLRKEYPLLKTSTSSLAVDASALPVTDSTP